MATASENLLNLSRELEAIGQQFAREQRDNVINGWKANGELDKQLIERTPAMPTVNISVKLDPDLKAALEAGADDFRILTVQLIRLLRANLDPSTMGLRMAIVPEEPKSGGATGQPAPG